MAWEVAVGDDIVGGGEALEIAGDYVSRKDGTTVDGGDVPHWSSRRSLVQPNPP